MGLAQVQEAMARLYTDAALRERFFADPHAGGEALGLSSGDTQQLAQLSRSQVTSFARSLRNKRLLDVVKQLPRTGSLLGERFVELFQRYTGTATPVGTRRQRVDALGFAGLIEQLALTEEIPLEVADAARIEAAWLKMADPTRRGAACWLRNPTPSLAVWFRPTRRGRLRHFVLTLPLWLRRAVYNVSPQRLRDTETSQRTAFPG